MWNLKYDVNEFPQSRNRCTDIQNRLVVAKGRGRGMVGRGMDWEYGIGRCKLLHSKWINNKGLMYSTGNSSQYSAMIYKRIKSKEE